MLTAPFGAKIDFRVQRLFARNTAIRARGPTWEDTWRPISPAAGKDRYSGGEHLVGGPLAGAYGSVHVPVPHLRRLRARPVYPSHGLPQRLAVARPHSGSEA